MAERVPKRINLTLSTEAMTSQQLLTVLLLHLPLALVSGFANRVPESSCTNMLPVHGRARPQTSRAPYDVAFTESTFYDKGVDISMTLSSGDIQGFMVQARHEQRMVGSWRAKGGVSQTLSCSNADDTIIHVNSDKKSVITLTWIPPSTDVGEVRFYVTFLHEYFTFWAVQTYGLLRAGPSYSNPGQGTGDPGQGTGDPGQGTGDPGQGTGDPGQGTGDPGQGTGDPGQGTEDPDTGAGNPDKSANGGLLPWHIGLIALLAGLFVTALLLSFICCCKETCLLCTDRCRPGYYSTKSSHTLQRSSSLHHDTVYEEEDLGRQTTWATMPVPLYYSYYMTDPRYANNRPWNANQLALSY